MSKTIEILTIGDEILAGNILDTNKQYLSDECWQRGLQIKYHTGIGDDENSIIDAIHRAAKRADVVLCTGGLGPTMDDFTIEIAARAFGTDLEYDDNTLQYLEELYKKKNIPLADNNRKQALVPKGGRALPNRVGTAPGVWYRFKDTDFYFMPGVPREMKALFQKQILPEVLEKIDGGLHFETCFLKTFGSTESQLDAKLSDLQSGRSKIQNARIGFRFHFPEIMLKVSVWDEDAAKAKKDHARVLAQIKERVGEFIYAEDEKTSLENVVVHKLSQNKKTCAFAESCTGGLISSRLTNVPGASEVFVGGVVSYSNELKQKLLGVSEDILKSEGAVSELCAKAMVEGLHQKTGADFCAAVTGIAGPSGGSPEKPVGTVFIATLCDGHLKVKRHNFSFPRTMFKEIVASVVFKKFLEAMSS